MEENNKKYAEEHKEKIAEYKKIYSKSEKGKLSKKKANKKYLMKTERFIN